MSDTSTEEFNLEDYVVRAGALDLSGIAWDAVPEYPLPEEAVRVLRYMQDTEAHTIIYLRELLATRAIDDPDVATFFACWFNEEIFHGRALAQFLRAAGHEPVQRVRSQETAWARFESVGIAYTARLWPDFVAVHMAWGAINELTTLNGYKRLAHLANHPVLTELLSRIARQESRHFLFYFQQAQLRLKRSPRVARVARFLVERFWDPVGAGVQPDEEVRFLASYLMSGSDGLATVRRHDATIRRLPGFEGIALLEAWMHKVQAISPHDEQHAGAAKLARS